MPRKPSQPTLLREERGEYTLTPRTNPARTPTAPACGHSSKTPPRAKLKVSLSAKLTTSSPSPTRPTIPPAPILSWPRSSKSGRKKDLQAKASTTASLSPRTFPKAKMTRSTTRTRTIPKCRTKPSCAIFCITPSQATLSSTGSAAQA